jgi:GMP synthase-like glutamine amidotransferase
MLSVTHSPKGFSVFAMSGNRKPAGIAFGPDVATEVQFRIELGAAIARNRLSQYLAELQAEKAQHDSLMPVPPPPPASVTA